MERGAYVGGTYRVIRPLGEGGTARVYLAVHLRTCALFAIKEIPLKGFWPRGELDYARHLSHPGLPVIHDLFQEGNCAYVIMDYIEGITLKELGKSKDSVRERELLDWMAQLEEICAYLHSRVPPLIHGDIKPSNLMLDGSGKLMLLDFGACLVKGREWKERYGTCGYASPEQLSGTVEPDFRSDFYSLGKTFRFLAKGRESRGLQKMLNRCLRKNPDERFSSDRELISRIRRLQRRGKRYCLLLSVLSFSLFLFGSFRRVNLQRENQEAKYQFLLESNQTNQVISAIKSFPDREEAYQKLLQLDLLDQDFSLEESRILEELLADHGAVFHGSSFYYELGIAYWYYFHDQGGKSYARIWFEKAMEGPLEEKHKERAEIYRILGEYCEKKARRELTGEGEFSWENFLSAMEAMCESESVITENTPELAEHLQEELLSLVYDSLPDLKRAGIEKGRLEKLLTELRALSPYTLTEQFTLTKESLNTIYGEEEK